MGPHLAAAYPASLFISLRGEESALPLTIAAEPLSFPI